MGRDELIARLNHEFASIQDAVTGLPEDQMKTVWYGEWSVNQILSHISGWHREMAKAFGRIARGERPVPEDVDYSDFDSWNHGFAAGQSDCEPAEVLAELQASHDAFVKAAEALPDEKFDEGRAAHRIIHVTGIDHYAEHVPPIREWRKELGI
jgi:Protein of unknown function (DUF1706)